MLRTVKGKIPTDPGFDLIGRGAETRCIDLLLMRLAESGGALLIRGDPGIGKSALLDYARSRAAATHTRVLHTLGVESEAQLAFAGLHQLLEPIADLTELLPDPQRRALHAAFGVDREFAPDPFLVALAAHQVLRPADARGQ
ncbi:MAG: AAA family ATPase, partial [Acidobacteriota bacterium]|nr:AAA family ATPase [Acidobacteriota bacterium]